MTKNIKKKQIEKSQSKFSEKNAEFLLSSSFFNKLFLNIQSFLYFNLSFRLLRTFELIDKNNATKSVSFMFIDIFKVEFKNISSSLLEVEHLD